MTEGLPRREGAFARLVELSELVADLAVWDLADDLTMRGRSVRADRRCDRAGIAELFERHAWRAGC
jgi:hypothetical protein